MESVDLLVGEKIIIPLRRRKSELELVLTQTEG